MQLRTPPNLGNQTSFIGRSWERKRLLEDLERGFGLLTLTGLSGIGKTSLARAVGAEVAEAHDFEGGVWFCSLESCESAADLEAAIARTLGIIHWTPGRLDRILAQKPRTLLVLDNGERLAGELGRLVAPWHKSCLNLQILVTSIIPLEIEGEIRHELGPLRAEDAISLYAERSLAAGRKVRDAEHPIVEELVGRLGWIPLAIELAAARAALLPPKDLLARMERPLDLVLSGAEGQRHGSLANALTITWELLSPREQEVFARAAIFAGGFTLEAAIAILGEEGDVSEILNLLDALRGKALLSIHEGESSSFSLQEGIRAFASEKLEEAGELEALSLRHANYYVEKGEADVSRLEGGDYRQALRALQADRDNLARVLKRDLDSRPLLAARAGLVLCGLAEAEGLLHSILPLVELTLQAAKASGDQSLVLRASVELVETRGQVDRPEERIAASTKILEMARNSGELRLEGRILLARALVYERIGEGAQALKDHEEIVRIARLVGDPLLEAMALTYGAVVYVNHREAAPAEARYEQLQMILREHGLERFLGRILPSLQGAIKLLSGHFREGRRAFQVALARSQKRGNSMWEYSERLNLAWLESAADRPEDAETHALEALRLSRDNLNRRAEGGALFFLGVVQIKRMEWTEAEATLSEAVGVLEAVGDQLWRARCLPYLAVAEARTGRFTEAGHSLEAARSFFLERELSPDLYLTNLLTAYVELVHARDLQGKDPLRAQELVEKARTCLAFAATDAEKALVASEIRLLAAELETWDSLEPGKEAAAGALLISPNADWFQVSQEKPVDLRRRTAYRRILDHLATLRLEQPGVGCSAHEVFAVGWPNAKVGVETELKRVYVGIWTLRRLGLGELLLNREGGYLLDPSIPLLRPTG